MTNQRAAWPLVIIVALALFIAANCLMLLAHVPFKIAAAQSVLEALQVNYLLIPQDMLNSTLLVVADILNVFVFALLTVVFAAWFYQFLSNVRVSEKIALSKIRNMQGHVIVVPYNGFARMLMDELQKSGMKAVTITSDRNVLAKLQDRKELALLGDIRYADAYESVGIDKASFVVACSDNDMQNAMIAITAKTANPHIGIISKVSSEVNIPKLTVAGVYKLVMPEVIAGENVGDEIVRRLL
jgi:voltage-gated potassium channel